MGFGVDRAEDVVELAADDDAEDDLDVDEEVDS